MGSEWLHVVIAKLTSEENHQYERVCGISLLRSLFARCTRDFAGRAGESLAARDAMAAAGKAVAVPGEGAGDRLATKANESR